MVTADQLTKVGGSGTEYGSPQMAPSVDRPLAGIRRNTTDRSSGNSATTATGQATSGPSPAKWASISTTARPPATVEATVSIRVLALGEPGLIVADELAQLPVAVHLAGVGLVDHHLARPYRFQRTGVAVVQGGEVLGDRISQTGGVGLLSLPTRRHWRTPETKASQPIATR